MIAQIIAELTRIISILGTVLGIVQTIQGSTVKAAQENSPFEIDTATQETLAIVTDGTFGLAALQAQIATLSGQLAIDITALVTQIGTPQQAGQPVTLPTTPPTGYGGDASWAVAVDSSGFLAGQLLSFCGNYARNIGQIQSAVAYDNTFFRLFPGNAWWGETFNGPTRSVTFSIQNAGLYLTLQDHLDGDTGLTWLASNIIDGHYQTDAGDGFGSQWFCTLTEAEWLFIKNGGSVPPPVGSGVPPIWPGLANVTLGSIVALSTGLTITEPMDGVIVTITSVPPGTGFFQFDDVTSWRYIGAVAFVSDNGQEEFPQTLGFQSAVYSCREMTSAVAVKVRTKPGIVGTVQTWQHV